MNQNPTMLPLTTAIATAHLQGLQTETRPWGRWTVLHTEPGMKAKLIEVAPGQRLSLQYHHHRSEFWICVAGRADALIGKHAMQLDMMQSLTIPLGMVHRLGNSGTETLLILEIQRGDELLEDDIVRLEDDYQRAPATRVRRLAKRKR